MTDLYALRSREETPVDDLRRVRERLSAQFGNDVPKLAEYARRVAEEYRARLGLKTAKRERAGECDM